MTSLPLGVDDAAGIAWQSAGRRDGDDAVALDPEVPGAHALGRHDLPTADHEIKHENHLRAVGGLGAMSRPHVI